MTTTWITGAAGPDGPYGDIRYEKSAAPDEGIAKITIARPEVRNAFRPRTIIEISQALEDAREDTQIGVIILTGEGTEAFCSGGDQRVRGDSGYLAEDDAGKAGVGRFHVTDLHVQIRRLPKPVVAMVAGYAIGGGHVLHLVCDLTIAADNARFGQVGPKVGSFDGGFGAGLLANLVGPKKAKEIWFLCRQYSAEEAREMGMVNTVVPLERLESETVRWCNEMLALSPFALRLLKASFNAAEDGLSGIQQLAHDANLLFYGSEEAQEGRDAYREKRPPEFRNRIDAIIQFAPLDPGTIERVADKLLVEVEAQLEQKGVMLNVEDDARAWIARKGYDPKMGARPMARVIQEHIKRPLAEELLFGKLAGGGQVRVSVNAAGDGLVIETVATEEPKLTA